MVESDDDKIALDTLKKVYFDAVKVKETYSKSFIYFDKMRSPIKRIKNKYRYQVLVRICDNIEEIENLFYEISSKYSSKNVLVYTEINPSSMS